MTPTIIELSQGSDGWHTWRKVGIGGSDAPIIMHDSPWKSPYALWQEKTGRRKAKPPSEYAKAGIEGEEAARAAYSAETGIFMPPACLQDADVEWLKVSLDGRSPDGKVILEVKCPQVITDHLAAREGQIPTKYWAQVQHALRVSGAELCHYWSYFKGSGVLVEIKPDHDYIDLELLPRELQFWEWVKSDSFPIPEDGSSEERDGDPAWLEAATRFRESEQMKKIADDRYEQAKARLVRLTRGYKVTRGAGLQLTWNYRREQPAHMVGPIADSLYVKVETTN